MVYSNLAANTSTIRNLCYNNSKVNVGSKQMGRIQPFSPTEQRTHKERNQTSYFISSRIPNIKYLPNNQSATECNR